MASQFLPKEGYDCRIIPCEPDISDSGGPIQILRPLNTLKLKAGSGPVDPEKLRRAEVAAGELIRHLPEIVEPEIAEHHLLSTYDRKASILLDVYSAPLGDGCFDNISLLDWDRVDNPLKAHN
jgi:hypothetical protein